jgi:hypothetical protein
MWLIASAVALFAALAAVPLFAAQAPKGAVPLPPVLLPDFPLLVTDKLIGLGWNPLAASLMADIAMDRILALNVSHNTCITYGNPDWLNSNFQWIVSNSDLLTPLFEQIILCYDSKAVGNKMIFIIPTAECEDADSLLMNYAVNNPFNR